MPQAERLETLVPGAGHLVHMPAHIYIRTGQYAKSAKSNADAAAVDEKYFKATNAGGTFYPTMYYGHNLQFESAAAMFAGNLAQARAAAQRTVALADPIADQMVMIEPFAAQELAVLVRFGQWGPILEAKAPAPTRTMQTSLYHFARGAALAATGKAAEAEAELAALKAVVRKGSEGRDGRRVEHGRRRADRRDRRSRRRASPRPRATPPPPSRDSPLRSRLRIKLGYNEPPDWLNPGARAARRAVAAAPAVTPTPRRCSAPISIKNVGNPRSLYGLYRSLEGAEEGRRRRGEGVVRQGLGRRRRDAWRRSVRHADRSLAFGGSS